jgi:N-glycosylase/DNA lyase
MALFEGESTKVIDKFNGENFNLWKFKMEMVLASMDLWEIVDESEEAPPSNADPKVIKEYQRRAKKAMSTIAINLVDGRTTSRGARYRWRHGRHFATSTKHRACPTSSSFATSSSRARCKREKTF